MNATPELPGEAGARAPARKKPGRRLLVIGGVILGVILLCAVLNGIAEYDARNPSHPLFAAAPSPLPPWQATTVGQVNAVPVVHAASGQLQTMDCTEITGMQVVLPNGDWVLVPCPAETVRLTSLTAEQMPAALPANVTFLSAMKIEVAPRVEKLIQPQFAHVDLKPGGKVTTLWWRGDEWIYETVEPQGDSPTNQWATMDGLFVLASLE